MSFAFLIAFKSVDKVDTEVLRWRNIDAQLCVCDHWPFLSVP